MKISQKRLRQIILEELQKSEEELPDPGIDAIIAKISDEEEQAALRLYIDNLKYKVIEK